MKEMRFDRLHFFVDSLFLNALMLFIREFFVQSMRQSNKLFECRGMSFINDQLFISKGK